jgi:hypothetical protein
MHGAVVPPASRFSSIASPNTSLAPRASPSVAAADALRSHRGSLTPVPAAAGAYLVGDGSQSPVVFRSVKIDGAHFCSNGNFSFSFLFFFCPGPHAPPPPSVIV